jgi:hypothetical protein
MGGILAFFGTGPARLKALLIGAAALAVLCLSLTTWALLERSGRLSCAAEAAKLEGQISVLSATVETQNTAIAGWKKAAEVQQAKGADARKAADQFVARVRPELERLLGLMKGGGTCPEAVAEVRKGLKP